MSYELWNSLHPDVQLVDGRYEDKQREGYCHQHVLLRAFEHIYQFEVGIGIYIINNVRDAVVSPVIGHAGEDGACTPVHPTQHQSNKKGMRHLCRIAVNKRKDGSRQSNHHPVVFPPGEAHISKIFSPG